MKFTNDNIADFLKDFTTFSRYGKGGTLNTNDFTQALRVFYWFNHNFEFKDVRAVCEKYNRLFKEEDKDPYSQDLHDLLVDYLEFGSIQKSWAFNFGNDIAFIIPTLAATHKSVLSDKGQIVDQDLYLEFCSKFKELDDVRDHVLIYINEFGFQHLNELSICINFALLDVIAVMDGVICSCTERSRSDQTKVYEFIKSIMAARKIDLTLGPSMHVQSINNFLEEFKTDENIT